MCSSDNIMQLCRVCTSITSSYMNQGAVISCIKSLKKMQVGQVRAPLIDQAMHSGMATVDEGGPSSG